MKKLIKEDLIYEANKYVFNFQHFKTMKYFIDCIFHVKIKIIEADTKQSNILRIILKFNGRNRSKARVDKMKRRDTCINALYERKEFLMPLKVNYFH